jgi:hypothetical protein
MKTCSKCGIEKERTEFTKKKQHKDGLDSNCKTCKSERNKEWRLNNTEKRKVDMQEFYKDHKKEWLEWNRKRRKDSWKGYAHTLWVRLLGRCINGKPRFIKANLRYLREGVELRLTRSELYQEVLKNWPRIKLIREEGGRPSIDRIGPSIHYEVGNIQFISLSENCRKAGKKSNELFPQKRKEEVITATCPH